MCLCNIFVNILLRCVYVIFLMMNCLINLELLLMLFNTNNIYGSIILNVGVEMKFNN